MIEVSKKGIFVVIEGLDGSGKTTQAKILAKKLRESHNAVYTAEPSRGKIGSFIRKRILYGANRTSVSIEALLFAADRIDHIQKEVQPALDEGKLVVSDRYIYSSLSYQGSAGLKLEWIETINQLALKPDLAIFIDVTPEVVLQRLKRKKSLMENLETQSKVREIYLKFVKKGELVLVDGNKPKKEVTKEALAIIAKFLKTRN